jgi:beta-N-acetylhexosaminidase
MGKNKPRPVQTLADVDRLVAEMSLDQKVGQCMTLAYYGTTITTEVIDRIEKLHCGGLRVTPHVNSADNPDIVRRLAPYCTPSQYAETLNELQRIAAARPLGLPLHMVTDQEGDLSVDILRGGVRLFPSQMGLAATGSPALVRRAARAVARQLRAMGIHMIHSPVLDVNLNPRNPEIGCRSFSNSADRCARYGDAFIKGLAEGGVIATGKHFPGRGDSAVDAHDTLPVLKVSRKRMDDVELLPYARLIPKGLPAVMTAHNAYPCLDPSGLPASISRRIVTGVLRGELGFDGLVTTDAMGMAGLQAICRTPEGCARALAAGNDLVLVKETDDTAFECHRTIRRWVEQGKIDEDELNGSVRRILALKLRTGLFAGRYVEPTGADEAVHDAKVVRAARDAARKCLRLGRDDAALLPLSPDQSIMVLLPIHPVYHEKGNDYWSVPTQLYQAVRRLAPQAVLVEYPIPDTPARWIRHAVRRSAEFDVVVAFDLVWRSKPLCHRVIRRLIRAGRRVVVVSNYEYDESFLPEAETLLLTYSAVPPGLDAAASALFGKLQPKGVCPLEK